MGVSTESVTLVDALVEIRRQRDVLDRAQFAAVLDARLAGVTWAEIGRALGVTAQAVQKRYVGL